MEIKIRLAVQEDLESVWQMWNTILEQKVYFCYDENSSKADIEKSWINLGNSIYVATYENEIVGAYIIKPNQPGYGAHIANASYMVTSAKRGLRIGHQLCAHSIIKAKEIGYRAMQFNIVVSTNKNAIKTWLDHGFEIIGTIPEGFNHVEKGYVDAHIFYRKL